MRIPICETALACLVLLLCAYPAAAQTQSPGKVPRIVFFAGGLSECRPNARDNAFRQGLLSYGYVPGKNIALERKCYRDPTEMRALLLDAIERKTDILVVGVPAAAIAARLVTRDTPIVCVSCGDPLDYGLVASLARPGGNVTGIASLSAELIGKRLELLKQVVPGVTRVAALINPENPGTRANLTALERAAPALGFEVQRFDFRTAEDFEPAFRSAAAARAGAILIQDDPFTLAGRLLIGELALKHRLPVVAGIPELADAGALIAYGPDRVELNRRVASFIHKIINGTKPGDLAIEQPSTFDLIINMKSANALGVPLSPALLARASRLVQ